MSPEYEYSNRQSVFDVILEDNETTRVLIHKLPMAINMSELNGNEKYCYLSDRLPAEPFYYSIEY